MSEITIDLLNKDCERFFETFNMEYRNIAYYELLELICLKENYDDIFQLEDDILNYFIEKGEKIGEDKIKKLKRIFWR